MMTDQFTFQNPIMPGSIWGKDSDYEVTVVSPVGEGPKGAKGDALTYADMSETDIENLRKGITNVANKSIDAVYTTTATTTTIEIPIADYDEFDMLFVDINGLDLAENDDYTISGGSIILTTPLPAGQEVHFRALRYQIPDGDKTIMNVMGRKDYSTVAEMQADTDLEAGDICHTLGFHEVGNGGDAWYKIVQHAVANDTDIFALENGLFAELQITELSENDLNDFITAEDLENFATVEDLENFATVEDLENFATAEDLNNLVTVEDLRNFVTVEKFTVESFSGSTVNIDVTKEGYTPVGIISISDGLDVADVAKFSISNGVAYITFSQTVSGDNIYITVLYIAV